MSRYKTLARALGAVVSVAVAFSAGQAMAQAKNMKFILDWAFQGQQALFTVPADDGTYARLGLNVTVDRGVGSGDTVTKIGSGAYDIGIADIYTMMNFNAENPSRKLIAVALIHDKSALSVASMKSKNIRNPLDLNGKKIAAPVGDASRQVFPLFAALNKIDQGSLNWINVTPQLRETMMIRGEADAITGHLTTILMNLRGINVPESDVNVMPYANYGVELYGHGILATPAFAEQNPEAVRNLIKAAVHGLGVMIKNPDAAVASIKKRDPLINDQVEKDRIKMSLDAMFISPNVMQNGMSNVDKARLSRTIDQVTQAFQLKAKPTVDEVYTEKFLPPRADLMLPR